MSAVDLGAFERERLAKLYRAQVRSLLQASAERDVSPEIASEIAALCDSLAQAALDLWPAPMSGDGWSIETESNVGPLRIVIKTRCGGESVARVWLRDAAGLAAALRTHADHEIADGGHA